MSMKPTSTATSGRGTSSLKSVMSLRSGGTVKTPKVLVRNINTRARTLSPPATTACTETLHITDCNDLRRSIGNHWPGTYSARDAVYHLILLKSVVGGPVKWGWKVREGKSFAQGRSWPTFSRERVWFPLTLEATSGRQNVEREKRRNEERKRKKGRERGREERVPYIVIV